MNLNLANDVAAANERSLNLKDNYVKARDQINRLKDSNKDLLAKEKQSSNQIYPNYRVHEFLFEILYDPKIFSQE